MFPHQVRWLNNIGIVVLDTAVVRVLFPTTAVGGGAVRATKQLGAVQCRNGPGGVGGDPLGDNSGFGHLPVACSGPRRARFVAFASITPDPDYDATGMRFHPLEIILSMLIKLMVVGALGAPPLAVLIFEVLPECLHDVQSW